MQYRVALVIAILGTVALAAAAQSPFEQHFENATLRVDYFHTGTATREVISIDRLYRQGIWAGPRGRLIDPFPYGGYLVQAWDAASGDLLFSRGFDSYFGEYRTTDAAENGIHRTYHETALLPFPKRTIRVAFSARRRDGTTTPLASTTIDPASIEIATEPPAGDVLVVTAHEAGPPHRSLDIALIGEGYTVAETDTFRADLARFSEVLLGHEPYATHRAKISVRGILSPSKDSGCDEPTRGRYRDTAIGVTFNSLGSERYMLTEANRSLRDIAANVPYDALVIMVNHDRYGGGGIYNLFCTFTAHSKWAEYLLLHEFGHSFSALADEYYSSSTAYNEFYPRGREPVEANITALLDPENLKWKELVTPGTALPTPWEKEVYDREDGAYQQKRRELNQAIAAAARSGAPEAEILELKQNEERHAAERVERARKYLAASEWAGQVGAFEGAGYSATGLYRPMLDCLMFSRRVQPYCVVCEGAVAEMIKRYTE